MKLGVSLGAIHDSAERSPFSLKFLRNTRKDVRQIILDWIHSESSASSFFWLYGSAGAGKTAILQAIADFLSESYENFGGSFFFSRGKKGRDKGHFLFSTIAYQLALKVPRLRQHINRIMESDPMLHTKSMSVQFQTLIVDAFKCLSPLPQRPYLVIIDGLDECHDKATQQLILQFLCETITVHKLPLRFLIGCRPESHIRDSFDQESLYTVTRQVSLDERFDSGRDIQLYLRHGFAEIARNSKLPVEHPWPGEDIVDLLVQRSSGQFIYAATVLRFVGADFCSPLKQLAVVLKSDPTVPSDLDQLYYQILSEYPSEVNIVHVLGIISVSHGELAEVMEDIFGMEEGKLKLVLRGLSSLVVDRNKESGERMNTGTTSYVIPHFAHASFGDYLFNPIRSGPFYVNRQEYENQVTIRSFALIKQSIR